MKQYDYIITGAGCAGLSLLYRMMQQSFFDNKKILLIDKTQKNHNDRTWCFWEVDNGLFENIVHHCWQQIDFYSSDFFARFDLHPYQYKMIRGIDLYDTVLNQAKQKTNIEIVCDEVLSVFGNESYAVVKSTSNEFHAQYVFNSILFDDWKQKALQQKNIHVLLQHFTGWMIELNDEKFDDRVATFMDFRVDQTHGSTFVYVLPVSSKKALIEFTLFSESILPGEEYSKALKNYIQTHLKITNYNITHKEFGIIPMTNYSFSKGEGRVINIGTAGNQTKASSGYTFQFIQKHSAKITDALVNNQNPLFKDSIADKRFRLYDSILLGILKHGKISGEKFFTQLFKKNPPQRILKFLDNETNLKDELKVMNSVSLPDFAAAALREIF